MKKIIFLAGFVGCTLLPSCDSILDVQPESIITSGSFWKEPNDAKVYMNGIYSAVRKWSNTSYYGEDRGDSFKPGEIGPVSVAWSQELLESNAPSYRDAYNIIHHCNLLFYRMQELNFNREEERNNILAECHFLRAYTYFQLLRSWGDVPIIEEPTLSDDVELKPRSSKEDVMALILNDLENAIGLFAQEGYKDKNKASKPAAYALKADALMWKAKVLGGGEQDLRSAIEMIENVEASGVRLLDDYRSVFDNDNKKNNEIIFSFYMERYETGNLSIASNTTSRTDNLSMAVNLTDAATSPNNSRHVYAPSEKVRSLYLKNKGDVRMDVALIDMIDKDGNTILTQTNKFRGKDYTDDRYFDDDLIVYRWADLLLLRAEAYAALGETAKAIADLDQIRNRAGLQGYSGHEDKLRLEKEICDERLRELFLEQKRWYDLVRFHFGGSINIYNEVPNLNDKQAYPLYLPINYNDMVLNEHLVQTEGYETSVER